MEHPKRSAEEVVLAGWVCAVIVWGRRGRAGRLAALAAPPLMRRGRRGAPRGGGGRGGTRARRGRTRGISHGRGVGFAPHGRPPLHFGALPRLAKARRQRAPTFRFARPMLRFAPPPPHASPPRPPPPPPPPPPSPPPAPAVRPRRILRPPPPPPQQNGGASSAASRPALPRRLYICSGLFPFVIFVVPFRPCFFIFVIFVVSICNAASSSL